MTRLGFIGLGRMGRPMSARLLEDGQRVIGYNIDEADRAGVASIDAPVSSEVPGREGLLRKQRSMISALNRSHELSAHVRGAINNSLKNEEISEVLLQVAICGGGGQFPTGS